MELSKSSAKYYNRFGQKRAKKNKNKTKKRSVSICPSYKEYLSHHSQPYQIQGSLWIWSHQIKHIFTPDHYLVINRGIKPCRIEPTTIRVYHTISRWLKLSRMRGLARSRVFRGRTVIQWHTACTIERWCRKPMDLRQTSRIRAQTVAFLNSVCFHR